LMIAAVTASAQRMSAAAWDEQAKNNIRLQPRYGLRQKTEEQKRIDSQFIEETMARMEFLDDRREASNHYLALGFNALTKKDLKTAMYRFNAAYLLDSANVGIYRGYGAVYMALGHYEGAQKQYKEGLAKAPDNAQLLTEYAAYFMAQYYGLQSLDQKTALSNLDSAISYLAKSYKIDPKDQHTTFKLSVCFWLKGRCAEARRYFDECE